MRMPNFDLVQGMVFLYMIKFGVTVGLLFVYAHTFTLTSQVVQLVA